MRDTGQEQMARAVNEELEIAKTVIGHNLNLPPNPLSLASEPGKFHDWLADKDTEIARLTLALGIAVQAIQGAPHTFLCGGWIFDFWKILPFCDCWKSSALARIERAKETGQ